MTDNPYKSLEAEGASLATAAESNGRWITLVAKVLGVVVLAALLGVLASLVLTYRGLFLGR